MSCRTEWLNLFVFLFLVPQLVLTDSFPGAELLSTTANYRTFRNGNEAKKRFFMPVETGIALRPNPSATKNYVARPFFDQRQRRVLDHLPSQRYYDSFKPVGFIPNHHQEIFFYKERNPIAGRPITTDYLFKAYATPIKEAPSSSNIKPNYAATLSPSHRSWTNPAIQSSTPSNYYSSVNHHVSHQGSSEYLPINTGSSTSPIFVFIPKPNAYGDERDKKPAYFAPSYSTTSLQDSSSLSRRPPSVNPQHPAVSAGHSLKIKPGYPSPIPYSPTIQQNSGHGLLVNPQLQQAHVQYTSNNIAYQHQISTKSHSGRTKLYQTDPTNQIKGIKQQANNNSHLSNISINLFPSVQLNKNSFLDPIINQGVTWPTPIKPAVKTQPNSFQRGSPGVFQNRPSELQSISSSINQVVPENNWSKLNNVEKNPESNHNWPIKSAESNLITSLELLPSASFSYNKIPLINETIQSDGCGGSWVVLDRPTTRIDTTKVQVEPIYPPFNKPLPFGRLRNNVLDKDKTIVDPSTTDDSLHVFLQNQEELQSFQLPSFITFPPGFNEPPEPDTTTKPFSRPDKFLFFATTPGDGDFVSTTSTSTSTPSPWRKPTSIRNSSTANLFSNSRPTNDNQVIPIGQLVSNGFIVRNEGAPAGKLASTIASTENSIIFSLNNHDNHQQEHFSPSIFRPFTDFSGNSPWQQDIIPPQSDDFRSPSPFLSDISHNDAVGLHSIPSKAVDFEIRDGVLSVSPTVTKNQERDEEQIVGNLLRQLRAANLRALSSLIEQAGIAPILQNGGKK